MKRSKLQVKKLLYAKFAAKREMITFNNKNIIHITGKNKIYSAKHSEKITNYKI